MFLSKRWPYSSSSAKILAFLCIIPVILIDDWWKGKTNGILTESSSFSWSKASVRGIAADLSRAIFTVFSGYPLPRKNSTISKLFAVKSSSSEQRRLSLKNWENGIVYNALMCWCQPGSESSTHQDIRDCYRIYSM